MFSKLALLALVTPLVSALTLHTPQDMRTQEEITITWDTAPGDPDFFTLELVNEEFNDAFAISSNIDPSQGSITVTIPVVPVRGGYTLEAVNVGNINEVYSTTGVFSVGALTSTSTRSTSGSTTSTGNGTSTRTGSTTGTGTSSTTTTQSTSTTPPATTQTSSTGANPAATNLSGASSLKINAVVAALAGIAGAAVFAL